MTYIGIDTRVHTGFAVWHSDTKYLAEVSTMTITQAMERVKMISDIRGKDSIRLFIEDARQYGTRAPEGSRKRLSRCINLGRLVQGARLAISDDCS